MNARALRVGVVSVLAGGLLASAAPAASAKTKQLTYRATQGDYVLSLKAQRVTGQPGGKRYDKLRLTLGQEGVVKGFQTFRIGGAAKSSWTIKPFVHLADVNGDGVPDGIVDIYTGGAHCCTNTAVALSTGPSSWAKPFVHEWGGFASLKDVDGNGVTEFVATDSRFDYAFTAHAGSALPVLIRAAQGGKLVDVTAQYPAALQADADEWRAALDDAVKASPTGEPWADRQLRRSVLAALLADLLRLNKVDEAKAAVAAAVARGDFPASDANDEVWDDGVGERLQLWGYTNDYKALGLPR